VTDTASTANKRLLLVDDHELLAEGLAASLRASGHDVAVAPTAASDEQVLALAADHKPDLVLLDLQLDHGRSGIDLIGPLRELGAPALILTGVTDRVHLAECLLAGAIGVAEKAQRFSDLLDIVERVLAGGSAMAPGEREELLSDFRSAMSARKEQLAPFRSLTAREQEVLGLLMEGVAAEAVAEKTFVSIATVRSHIRSILTKLGVSSQLAAVALARKAGWEPTPES
jgi:DNA-binding NarL/FixJ family response regulator